MRKVKLNFRPINQIMDLEMFRLRKKTCEQATTSPIKKSPHHGIGGYNYIRRNTQPPSRIRRRHECHNTDREKYKQLEIKTNQKNQIIIILRKSAYKYNERNNIELGTEFCLSQCTRLWCTLSPFLLPKRS